MTRPLLYRAGQTLLAPGARRRLASHLEAWAGCHDLGRRVLDVGCGPRSMLDALGADPIGLDLSPSVVRARARGGGRGVVAEASELPLAGAVFDSVWSFGLLHHLPDAHAERALIEMQRVTRPGGHVVVFDGVMPTGRGHRLAGPVRRIDRGRSMRTVGDLSALLHRVGDWQDDLIVYAGTGLEGLLATWTAPGRP